jgi:hypothetical protein
MSEVSFGAGAEARGRIGNVFLAFAEVKRTRSECQRSRCSTGLSLEGKEIGRNVSHRLRETSPP